MIGISFRFMKVLTSKVLWAQDAEVTDTQAPPKSLAPSTEVNLCLPKRQPVDKEEINICTTFLACDPAYCRPHHPCLHHRRLARDAIVALAAVAMAVIAILVLVAAVEQFEISGGTVRCRE